MADRDDATTAIYGVAAIEAVFASTRAQGRAAFMPYFTLGYPTLEQSLYVIEGLAASADIIELGIPFSDPLADGPTIQHSTQVALEQGITVARCIEAVQELRARGVQAPLVLMTYANPILAYGLPHFTQAARDAGASGVIVPDLPPEEAGELATECASHELAVIYLLAPTSTEARIKYVVSDATCFVYLVALKGVTGARDTLPADLSDFIARTRAVTDKPLAVGFGISTPQQARSVGEQADGVIVGSALVQAASRDADEAIALAVEIRAALSQRPA